MVDSLTCGDIPATIPWLAIIMMVVRATPNVVVCTKLSRERLVVVLRAAAS